MEDTKHLDATALAELVRRKEVSPLELVDEAIGRIERINPRLNAVVTPMFEQARADASKPLPEGPFTGVPFLVKDILATVAGVRMTSGSAALARFVPTSDSTLISRFRKAGLVFVGKTNTPEFGFLPTTEPRFLGACHSPWDLGRTTGGSSGGSASAVAAGLVPMAHASDGGGSIRIPASCCGLFGLKPTRARVSLGPALGDIMNGLVIEHALTRSVRDCAALLDAVAGPAPGDPYVAPERVRPYREEVGAPPGKLRIALSTEPVMGGEVHPACLAAARDAASLCAELGHEVVEARPKVDASLLGPMFIVVWSSGAAATLDSFAFLLGKPIAETDVEPLSWALAEMGRSQPASRYLLAIAYLQGLSRGIARFMKDFDVWLTPTLAEPPCPLGSFDAKPGEPLAGLERAAAFSPFTPMANVTGQPAMSVPLTWSEEGLPVGVQFAGRYGDEATLFRLAAQLEQARPWSNRRPPVHA